jgi:hypothetical protein
VELASGSFLFGFIFQSVGMYKMYIEEVKDLRIATKDSPAFINLILDFTVTSSLLFSEYKVNFHPCLPTNLYLSFISCQFI